MTEIHLSWSDASMAAAQLAYRHKDAKYTNIYGPPRGGVPVALMVGEILGLPMTSTPAATDTLVVDDLIDTGATLHPYVAEGYVVDALYRKPHSPPTIAPAAIPLDGWLVFPWESPDELPAADGVVRLLEAIGEDPTRDGLLDTPNRVVKALTEMTAGMHEDPVAALATTFDVAYDELVALIHYPFVSLCEHHLLPFTGHASVGYLPAARVVGLSKLGRVVDIYARRLQVQERLTQQIATTIGDTLGAQGVGVVIRATHGCMSCRGVNKAATMVTSSMLGKFRDVPELRAEFLALERNGG